MTTYENVFTFRQMQSIEMIIKNSTHTILMGYDTQCRWRISTDCIHFYPCTFPKYTRNFRNGILHGWVKIRQTNYVIKWWYEDEQEF